MSRAPHPASQPATPGSDAVQWRYARLLEWGVRVGMALLVASFTAYVLGLLPAQVPVRRMPEFWGQPLARYLALTGAPTGWTWVMHLGQGDFAAMTGIALLAGCSGLCLLSLLPIYRRHGDRVYFFLCLAHLAVIVVAASGWLVARR